MNKENGFGAGLLPLIAAAGLVSGTFLRPAPVGPERNQREARTERAQAEAAPEVPGAQGLADAQPVLDLLAESMGVSLEPSVSRRAAQALRRDAERGGSVSSREVIEALRKLETSPARSSTTTTVPDAASIVDSYLRTETDPGARLHKLRAQLVDRLFDDAAAAESL